MSFWSRLFSAPTALEKATDAVIATGDKLVLTDEERLDYHQGFRDWYLKWMEASSGSRLARRLIGVSFTATFLFLVVWASAFYASGALFGVPEATAAGTAILGVVADTLVIPTSIIVGFYFGAPVASELMKEKK